MRQCWTFPLTGPGKLWRVCSKISRVTGAACVNSRCVSRWCGGRGGAPPPDSQNKHPRPRTPCWRRWTCPAPPPLGARLQQHHNNNNYKKTSITTAQKPCCWFESGSGSETWSYLFVITMRTVYTILYLYGNDYPWLHTYLFKKLRKDLKVLKSPFCTFKICYSFNMVIFFGSNAVSGSGMPW